MIETLTMMKSVALYCRLSKDDGTLSDSSSIQSQKELLTKYADDHRWNIFDIYADDGYSGTNFDRPGFQRMCKDIEKGKIDIVIVKDLSRLGRNYIKTGYYTEEYFPNHNVRFIALSDNIDTNKENDAAMDFAPFKNVINEWYARDTSKKIRSIFNMRRKQGILIKSAVPLYGYKYGPNNTIEIDEETAPVVRYLFTEFAKGTSTAEMKQYLFDNKIYTPGYYVSKKYNYNTERYKDYSEEKRYTWKTCIIDRLVSNIEYTGLFISSKTATINFKNHRRKKISNKEEYTFEGIRPQIISKEIYDKVMERKNLSYKPRKKEDDLAPLQGLLYCASCGRIMNYKTLTNVRGKYHQEFYACRSKKCDLIAYVNEKAIHQIVHETMESLKEYLIEKEELLYEFARNYVPKQEKEDNEQEIKIKTEKLKVELKELETKIINLFEDHRAGRLPTVIYDKYSNEYKEEYENKTSELNKLKLPRIKPSKIDYEEQARLFIKSLKEYKDILNKDLLYMLLDKIYVGKDFIYGETNRTHYKVTVKMVFAINDYCLEEFMKRYNN